MHVLRHNGHMKVLYKLQGFVEKNFQNIEHWRSPEPSYINDYGYPVGSEPVVGSYVEALSVLDEIVYEVLPGEFQEMAQA